MTLKPKNEAIPCTGEVLFKYTTNEDTDLEAFEKYTKSVDQYLSMFAEPVIRDNKYFCLNCDREQSSVMSLLSPENHASIRWGLAHGEGECTACGWPYRGMHYAKDENGEDLFNLRNFFLAYMPEFVESNT